MKDKRSSAIIFGCILIVISIALLLIAFRVVKTNFDIGPYWPALLIFAGALTASSGNVAIPFGMVSAGAILLARNLGLFGSESSIGGVLLLLTGVGILALTASPKTPPAE